MLEDAAEEPASHLRERDVVPVRGGQVALAGGVPKTEVNMEAASGPMAIWLWHEGRDIALVTRQIADRVLE